MPLDITGYNATFDAFANFAKVQSDAGKQKAVARVDVPRVGTLENRIVKAASGDWVGVGQGRLWTLKEANNAARALFRKAVAEMFGGERNIPKSVVEAMKMQDYGKGKPLTARRILAVKTAIDGYFEQKAFDEGISKFQEKGTEAAAAKLGYAKAEMPRLASAVNLYAKAVGCSEAEALAEVATHNSKANRLMNYGGRFLQSVDNFRNGLALIDSFGKWFDQTSAMMDGKLRGAEPKYEAGMSQTLLNADTSMFGKDEKLGFEKFAFEEIAHNPAFDLSSRDGNALFGMENNAATSCIGRKFCKDMMQTLVQIPPEKRTLFFKALATLSPLYASTADQAAVPPSNRHNIAANKASYVASRILRNFEKVAELEDAGRMNAAKLVKLCFPEIKRPGSDPIGAVVDLIDGWIVDMHGGEFDWETGEQRTPPKYPEKNADGMINVMLATGCTIEEADIAVTEGKTPPHVPYYSPGTLSLGGLDGSTTQARADLLNDLVRPSDYTLNSDPAKGLLGEGCGFKFNLPNGKTLVANSTAQGRAGAEAVLAELEALCGKAHPRQAANLMMMTSASGLSPLKGGLERHGVGSNEHAAVDFTLARNEDTGVITIRYTSPRELPFSFDWTASIDVDGRISTTPLRFADEATLKAEVDATAEVIRNARVIKNLPPEEKEKAVSAIMENVRNDRDLMTLLRMHGGEVVLGVAVNGASHIRSPEGIQKKLNALRANIDELRATSGGQRAFEAGLKQISLLSGTAFAPGVITKMCKLAAEADLDSLKIKGLSESSSPEEIFEAVCNIDRMVRKLFTEAKVMTSFGESLSGIDSPGMTERSCSTSMAMAFLFARCDEGVLNSFRAALNSVNTQKLGSVLLDLQEGRYPPGVGIAPGVQGAIMDVATMMSISVMSEIEGAVSDILGAESPNREDAAKDIARSERPEASPESAVKILDLIEQQILAVDVYRQIVNRYDQMLGNRPVQMQL